MKELEDYKWFPAWLRNFQTEFIGFVVARFNVYDTFINYLKSSNLVKQPMTDLCSGSGEPAISIFKKSNCFSNLLLTDKYPRALETKNANIYYQKSEKDVLEMEFNRGTYYTMFNSFHHFKDHEKRTIVKQIQKAGSNASFVEILEPTFPCLLKILCITVIGSLLVTPFIVPFSLKRLLFTYILPLNVLTITIDGIISVFKSRSEAYYRKLFADDKNSVKVFRIKSNLSPLIVIQIQSKI